MPNNPVQVVLNPDAFHQAPDPGRNGGGKDFFEGADAAFAAHRSSLLAAVDAIIDSIEKSEYGPAAYLRVRMREQALAKSYRPVRWLFKPDQFPCVGAEAVGTLYFRAPLIYLNHFRRRIEEAESKVVTKISTKTGMPYKAPSTARSEVGLLKVS